MITDEMVEAADAGAKTYLAGFENITITCGTDKGGLGTGLLRAILEAALPVVLREGFERGAQWAAMDLAHRDGNFFVMISEDGSPMTKEEQSQAMTRHIIELFVPKPEVKS
ncbi:MAG: hypothetical protein ABR949_10220 [Candidatus Aquilonibacter sp.]|jgi:hypothetical protein